MKTSTVNYARPTTIHADPQTSPNTAQGYQESHELARLAGDVSSNHSLTLEAAQEAFLRALDVDLDARTLKVSAGKGMVSREIELETKDVKALKNWIDARP